MASRATAPMTPAIATGGTLREAGGAAATWSVAAATGASSVAQREQ